MPPIRSLVWDYFSVSETNNLLAKCLFNDNAANIVCAVEGLTGVEECSCLCHTLQLAIHDTFNAVTGNSFIQQYKTFIFYE